MSDGGGEVFAADRDLFAGEDNALFAYLESIDKPEFVFENDGIDQNGSWVASERFCKRRR